jgi:DNA mismatch repair protein MutS
MGGRLLRQRLLRPSLSKAEIEERLDAVGEFLRETILRAELRKELAGVLDLERLLAKVTLGSAGPRDLLALGKSLERIPLLRLRVENRQSARLQRICASLDDVPEVRDRILSAIADEPPMLLADGGAIRPGYNAELDELRDLSRNGKQYIAQIEARERERLLPGRTIRDQRDEAHRSSSRELHPWQ